MPSKEFEAFQALNNPAPPDPEVEKEQLLIGDFNQAVIRHIVCDLKSPGGIIDHMECQFQLKPDRKTISHFCAVTGKEETFTL